MLAAGVAALILLAMIVYAVIRTSDGSKTPETVPPPPASATSSTYTTPSTSSTSYSVPRVQTSQDNPVVTGPPAESTEGPDDQGTTEPPTTFTNPYPTTTPTNAGHI